MTEHWQNRFSKAEYTGVYINENKGQRWDWEYNRPRYCLLKEDREPESMPGVSDMGVPHREDDPHNICL